MNRKKLVVFSITGIVITLISIIGISYGYYASNIIGNTNRNSIYVTSVTSTLLYEELDVDDGKNKFTDLTSITPGVTAQEKFNVTNIGKTNVDSYGVYFEEIINTFTRTEDLVITLTCKEYDKNDNYVKDCNGINTTYPTENQLLVTNSIQIGYTHKYTLDFEYKNLSDVNQDIDLGNTLSGMIQIQNEAESVSISGTVTGYVKGTNSNIPDGDYIEVHSDPKISQIRSDNTYKITGLEVGNHTIYLKSRDGVTKASKDFRIMKSTDGSESVSEDATQIIINDNTEEVIIDVTYENSNLTLKPTVKKYLLVDKIKADNVDPLTNNEVPSDGVNSTYVNNTTPGINFSAISSDTNGKGLYVTSDLTKTEDIDGDGTGEPVYYYRGAVTNNFVQFGSYPAGTTVNGTTYEEETPMYWKIIRINEDGSIRMIYNGTSTSATGSAVTIGKSQFNSSYNDNAYVGYMYGTTAQSGEDAYNLTHSNDNPSTIKEVIDNWFVNNTNLPSLKSSYLADAGFCNDRSVAPTANTWYSGDTALGYANNITYYGSYNRLFTNKIPQFACPNVDNDLFTTSESIKGNKALSNPIGLITADEAAYSGGVYNVSNKSYYLYVTGGYNYWPMTPYAFFSTMVGNSANVWRADASGSLHYLSTNFTINYVRPVINLQSTVVLSDELPDGCELMNGTSSCPYIIDTSV